MSEIVWDVVSPLQGEKVGGSGQVVLEEKPYMSMAMISLKRGKKTKLSDKEIKSLGIVEINNDAIVRTGKGYSWLWVGFNQWLVIGKEDVYSFLKENLKNCSVSQQHGSRVHIYLHGEKSIDVLEKMVLIDLDPKVFKVGDIAQTNLGHINATLWREKDHDNSKAYSILVFSSFAMSLWQDIKEASQEYGLEIKRSYP